MDHPKVWVCFEKTSKEGKIIKFRIQTITRDMADQVADFMRVHFLPDEPFTIATDLFSTPSEIDKLQKVWIERVIPEGLSIVCLTDDGSDSPEIVGLNLLIVAKKGEEELSEEPRAMMKILRYIENQYDIFESFNVDAYLTGFGLAVKKMYRGMSIGTEILLVRTQICQELGLKMSSTIFASVAGQTTAERAGFEKYLEINYKELEAKFDCKFGDEMKSAFVMNKFIKKS